MKSQYLFPKDRLSMGLFSAASLLAMDVSAAILEEVVVTSRKRAESLQETPISVMAFGGDSLERQNVSDLKGLDVKLPNVSIGGSGGLGGSNAAFYVRGVGTGRNAVNQESAVALYVDDAYIGRSDGALLSVVDVEKIEVLRGPQGTLFGRSATAGAIRYVTAKPEYYELSGKAQVTLGSENKRDFKGVINVPLGDDAAVRLMGASLNQDGHVDGAFTGDDYGDENSDLVRAYLRWSVNESVEILAAVDHTKMDTNGGASILLGVNPNPPPSGPAGVVLHNEAAAGYDATSLPVGGFDSSYQTGDNFYDSGNTGANLTVNWDINDSLAFKSATTWRDIDIDGAYDADGTFAALYQQDFKRTIETFSQEFQLSGSTGDLQWVTGLFYYDEESTDHRIVGSGTNSTSTSNTRIVDPYTVESTAVFGQGTYNIDDQWSATIGLRYTRDEKSISANELRQDNVTEKVATVNRAESWDALSGRISLECQVNDDIFVFGSFARGYRSGGFNDRIRTNLPNNFFGITDFDEETLDMYELGFRSELFDNQVRFNMTAFYGLFNDRQLGEVVIDNGVQTNRTAVTNAGESKVQGIEAEFMWAATDIITIDATLGLLDTEYTELSSGVTAVTTDSDFARAPELSYSIGIEADFDDVTARLGYGWKDDQRLTEGDTTGIVQDSYGLLSVNITYALEGSGWLVSLYGNNLTDEEYLVSGLDFRANPVAVLQGEPGRFREFGVKVGFEF